MATSFEVASKLGPVHLVGQQFLRFQRNFSLPSSFIKTTETFFRALLP